MIKHPISTPRSQIYGFKVHLFFLKNRNYRNPDTRFDGDEVKQSRVLMSLREKALENIVGKRENVDDNHVFPPFFKFFFLPILILITLPQYHFICRLQNL